MKKSILIMLFCMILITGCGITGKFIDTVEKEQAYIELALEFSDASICDNIEDNRTVHYCYEQIAAKTGSVEICHKITNDRYWSDICFKAVAELNQDKSICFNVQRIEDKDSCIHNIALLKNESDICLDITNLEKEEFCIKEIAVRTLDHTICKNIITPLNRDTCYYKLAEAKNNKAICDYIGIEQIQAACLAKE
jgi:hypothetical protein